MDDLSIILAFIFSIPLTFIFGITLSVRVHIRIINTIATLY